MTDRKLAATLIALGGALVLVGLGVILAVLSLRSGDPSTTRVEFTDKVGRHCVQVGSAAIDCDYPPVESRAGKFLDDLSGGQP